MQIKGVDVSRHNGAINWRKVKAEGIEFVIIRAGYGSSTVDEKFKSNIEGAINAGIDVGIYWFSYAVNEEKAKNEAKKCMEVIKPYKSKITYPVFYDFEYDSIRYAKERGVSINKTKASNFARAFLEEIRAGGYIPGLYTNIDFSKNYFTKEVQREYDIWIAQYASRTTYSEPYVIWQYSDKGSVRGINGGADLNYCYKDYTLKTKVYKHKLLKANNNESNNSIYENSKKLLIRQLQKALNISYETSLAVDGMYGPKTQEVVRNHPLYIELKNKQLEHVKWIQQTLNDLGYELAVDGHYGSETRATVIKYQESRNLEVDGMAGPETHKALISDKYSKKLLIRQLQKALNISYETSLAVDGMYGPKTQEVVRNHPLYIELKNKQLEHVKWIQQTLNDLGYELAVDGHYGSETRATVIKYQESKNLEVDGMAGPETHKSLVS